MENSSENEEPAKFQARKLKTNVWNEMEDAR